MSPETESSERIPVFRHESGAEMPKRGVGYSAMYGVVRVEGNIGDDGIHLNGYYYQRTERPSDQSPPQVSHPWPTITLSRNLIAELCDVIDRNAANPFDWVGVDAGHIYVAYDADPERLGRNKDTEERVYAVPDYQTALIEFPISHLSARATDDGHYRFYGYNPDGPSAEQRTI